MKKILYGILAAVLCTSCVTKKKFTDLSDELDDCYKTKQANLATITANKKEITDLNASNDSLRRAVDRLIDDTASLNRQLAQLRDDHASLRALNKNLADQLKNSRSESEVKQILAQLQNMTDKLQSREDSLAAKEKEMQRLTSLLNRQDSLMRDLKRKVSDALTKFEGKGLSVVTKNGKVYVSMDEKLLFQSGKWDVDAKGVQALNSIGEFLAENKDIHVVIEGHTDKLPYTGNGYILDNWDLSTKRATAIVRVLLGDKDIDPSRITASGRASYVPLDEADTKEARQKNRRTEIILSPNMDEIMKLLGNE